MGTLSTTTRAMMETRKTLQRVRVEAGIERILRRDYQMAFRGTDQGTWSFVGQDGGSGMSFFSINTLARAGAQSGSGVNRVSYSIQSSSTTPGTFELMRCEQPFTPGKPLPDRPAERLAAGLASCQIRFYDGLHWADRWKRNELPQMVRMVFTFADEADGQAGAARQVFVSPCVSTDADPMPLK
jgi:hypothetical protein